LHEQDTRAAEKRQQSVVNGTWDARAEWVSQLIERRLSEKNDS
jgi:hypothetical protein